jgi:hypothetical protein
VGWAAPRFEVGSHSQVVEVVTTVVVVEP